MTLRRAAAVLSLLATSCGDSGDPPLVVWTALTERPAGTVLSSSLVSVPAGASVAARPNIVQDGDSLDCDATVTSSAPEVLQIDNAEDGSTVFTGVSVGKAELSVSCGERGPIELPGEVTKATSK
jgi:hypothetical protein